MKFCEECNNMLYPLEDKLNKRLLFLCKRCNSKVVSGDKQLDKRVYINKVVTIYDNLKDSETDINPEMINDPTLQRTSDIKCKKCSMPNCVFFGAHSKNPDEALALIFVCRRKECLFTWKEM